MAKLFFIILANPKPIEYTECLYSINIKLRKSTGKYIILDRGKLNHLRIIVSFQF